MIDTHSHVLYGVDDGARTIEESINIIKKMHEIGYNHIIATPHYIENTDFKSSSTVNKLIIKSIREELIKENIPVNVYLGNEVYISDKIIETISMREVHTLNNSNYILIELPINVHFESAMDMFYELQRRGAKIILAHPERYVYFQNNKKLVNEFLENGILFQGNIESLSGRYGSDAKKLFIKLLKENKYFVLGSDIHRESSDFFKNFKKNKAKIIKLTSNKTFDDLVINNPSKILLNII